MSPLNFFSKTTSSPTSKILSFIKIPFYHQLSPPLPPPQLTPNNTLHTTPPQLTPDPPIPKPPTPPPHVAFQ